MTDLRDNFNRPIERERNKVESPPSLLSKVKANEMLAGLSRSCKYLD